MKVALVHYRLLHRGGLERRLFNYMNWFLTNGYEVTLFVSKIEKGIEPPVGVKLIQTEVKKWPKPFRQWIYALKLRKLIVAGNFDFSLSLGRTFSQDAVLAPGNHLGYLRATGKKCKGIDDRIQTHLDRKAYRDSRIILAASEMMRNEVLELFGEREEKVKVLYPPSDPFQFNFRVRENREALRKKYGFSQGKISFLFVSAGHFRKGLPLLLEIFSQLKEEPFELLIAGTEIKNIDLPNVKFLGFVNQSEELYAAADFTIHPSIYEPFGQVVPESIMCGTPVIISARVGAKEIVSKEEGIIVDSFETKEWIGAIRSLKNRKFNIHPDFAVQREITLNQHMEKMLEHSGLKKKIV